MNQASVLKLSGAARGMVLTRVDVADAVPEKRNAVPRLAGDRPADPWGHQAAAGAVVGAREVGQYAA